MRTRLLARSRARRLCAFAAVAVGLAGCGSTGSSSVTVAGKNLTIYASEPSGDAGAQQIQDVIDAEQLALKQTGSQIGGFTLRLVTLDGKELSDNARSAIADATAIAYLGEIIPGESTETVGITNDQDLLQVSPTDTAVALTQASAAVPGSPGIYYEELGTYGRTFARVVPNTALEARAMVSEMQSLGVSRLYVTGDGSDYGKALALEVKTDATPGITVSSSESGANGVLYAGSSQPGATSVFNQAAASNPSVKLFAPSALAVESFPTGLSSAAQAALYVTQPGFYKDLTAAGERFVSAFQSTYGHAPAPEAIFGYEAMDSVLAVLRQAGSAANNRSTVVHDYFAVKNRQSVLGTYSISSSTGDTSLDAFTVSRVENGQLVPFKSLADQG